MQPVRDGAGGLGETRKKKVINLKADGVNGGGRALKKIREESCRDWGEAVTRC